MFNLVTSCSSLLNHCVLTCHFYLFQMSEGDQVYYDLFVEQEADVDVINRVEAAAAPFS